MPPGDSNIPRHWVVLDLPAWSTFAILPSPDHTIVPPSTRGPADIPLWIGRPEASFSQENSYRRYVIASLTGLEIQLLRKYVIEPNDKHTAARVLDSLAQSSDPFNDTSMDYLMYDRETAMMHIISQDPPISTDGRRIVRNVPQPLPQPRCKPASGNDYEWYAVHYENTLRACAALDWATNWEARLTGMSLVRGWNGNVFSLLELVRCWKHRSANALADMRWAQVRMAPYVTAITLGMSLYQTLGTSASDTDLPPLSELYLEQRERRAGRDNADQSTTASSGEDSEDGTAPQHDDDAKKRRFMRYMAEMMEKLSAPRRVDTSLTFDCRRPLWIFGLKS
jgi:hypothetical protein